ncbi:hypothetical protein ANN_23325 [Periplaneta americana]|uniref:Uncharacterized protein n=1 Tax=Periplaneta americana TaxID=6978 RepID=A0ABQ8SKU4_PERAM|nr:hypothetical protein ANN_23325 [Periplaneta americana]
MAGLCEGDNEPPGSLKAIELNPLRYRSQELKDENAYNLIRNSHGTVMRIHVLGNFFIFKATSQQVEKFPFPINLLVTTSSVLRVQLAAQMVGSLYQNTDFRLSAATHIDHLCSIALFLWGILKQHLSKHRYQTFEDLKQAVREAFREITPPLLRKISHRTWRRIILCRDNDGAHIGVLDHQTSWNDYQPDIALGEFSPANIESTFIFKDGRAVGRTTIWLQEGKSNKAAAAAAAAAADDDDADADDIHYDNHIEVQKINLFL